MSTRPRTRLSRIPAISRLTVAGIKSIWDEVSIDIRPLTVIAGENSAGKSTLMQALLLLKQSLQSKHDPGRLLLNGEHVKFTKWEQLLSRRKIRSKAEFFSIAITDDQGRTTGIKFIPEYGGGLVQSVSVSNSMQESPKEMPVELSESSDGEEIKKVLPKRSIQIAHQVLGFSGKTKASAIEYACSRDRFFLTVSASLPGIMERPSHRSRFMGGFPVFSFSTGTPYGSPLFWYADEDENQALSPAHLIQNIIHLPGLRDNPERDYPKTGSGEYYDGPFPAYTASMIYQWKVGDSERLKMLAKFLERMELTHSIEVEAPNDAQVRLRVGRLVHAPQKPASDVMVDIADVGIGVSQALPILVALLAARPGQLVYIEQPEIHLHPRAQVKLAEIIAEMSVRQHLRVVVETHSYIMLRTFQAILAEADGKGIKPDDVVLHWVTRPNGVTKIDSVSLDESGRFTDPWPEDFSKVARDVETRYIRAVAAKTVPKGK